MADILDIRTPLEKRRDEIEAEIDELEERVDALNYDISQRRKLLDEMPRYDAETQTFIVHYPGGK